jgi:hypothetical protein
MIVGFEKTSMVSMCKHDLRAKTSKERLRTSTTCMHCDEIPQIKIMLQSQTRCITHHHMVYLENMSTSKIHV